MGFPPWQNSLHRASGIATRHTIAIRPEGLGGIYWTMVSTDTLVEGNGLEATFTTRYPATQLCGCLQPVTARPSPRRSCVFPRPHPGLFKRETQRPRMCRAGRPAPRETG